MVRIIQLEDHGRVSMMGLVVNRAGLRYVDGRKAYLMLLVIHGLRL